MLQLCKTDREQDQLDLVQNITVWGFESECTSLLQCTTDIALLRCCSICLCGGCPKAVGGDISSYLCEQMGFKMYL